MLEGSYGKEPFDLRLTVLRMIRQWKKIVLVTLAGTLIVGGIYYANKVLLRSGKQYCAASVYRMDYSVDDKDIYLTMINSYTWNSYMHTEEFLNCVRKRLSGSSWEDMNNEELGGYIVGDIESDWRVPSTMVITDDMEKSTAIARAVEETLTLDFPEGIREVSSIRVMDHAGEAKEVIPDLRIARALILGAVLTFFFAVIILLLKELGDDNIWLPSTIRRRYGLKAVGTVKSRELTENICYLFAGAEQAAVCTVQKECDPAEVADVIREACADTDAGQINWYAVPSLLMCPEAAASLRKADGILLAVKAGAHAGKQLEYVMDFLTQQDLKITAVILWGADEVLLRWYYGGNK